MSVTVENSNKYRINGAVGTLLFHAIILLLLLLFGFSTSLPLPGEEGVEVNLGYMDEGLGDIQPIQSMATEFSSPPPIETAKPEESVVTQNIEEAPFFEESKEIKTEKKPDEIIPEKKPEEVIKKEPEINPAALYKGKKTDPNASLHEGISGGEGDQGKPEGTIDAKEYLGKGGFGDGLSYSLEGRTPKYLPKPSSNFSENGTVVVQITVNKYGNVENAIAIDKGSNTTNTLLRKLAEDAALKAKFNANMNAAEYQRGTITYHFVVKN